MIVSVFALCLFTVLRSLLNVTLSPLCAFDCQDMCTVFFLCHLRVGLEVWFSLLTQRSLWCFVGLPELCSVEDSTARKLLDVLMLINYYKLGLEVRTVASMPNLDFSSFRRPVVTLILTMIHSFIF